MAKGIFALGCGLSMALLTASPVRAESVKHVVARDGCSILAAAVFEQVTASAWSHAGRRPSMASADEIEIVSCHQTARAVSGAFARAMETMNVYVSWQDPRDIRGDVCLSGDLSQCYPHRNPFVPLHAGADLAFMYSSWHAVQTTTMRLSQDDSNGDTSRFSAAALKNELRRSLKKASTVSRGRLLP